MDTLTLSRKELYRPWLLKAARRDADYEWPTSDGGGHHAVGLGSYSAPHVFEENFLARVLVTPIVFVWSDVEALGGRGENVTVVKQASVGGRSRRRMPAGPRALTMGRITARRFAPGDGVREGRDVGRRARHTLGRFGPFRTAGPGPGN